MDKKTIIAVSIIAVLFSLWYLVVNPLILGRKPFELTAAPSAAAEPTATPAPTASPTPAPTPSPAPAKAEAPRGSAKPASDAKPAAIEREYVIRTDVLTATFSNKGGQLVSLRLLKHRDKGEPVEMILRGDDGSYFFGTSFGDYGTPVSTDLMDARMIDDRTIEFSHTYEAPGAPGETVPFAFKKRFSFRPGEYMFDAQFSIENSVNAVPNLLNKGYAYTLFMGPQIGPVFGKLSNYDETRSYRTYANGKVSKHSLGKGAVKAVKDRVLWASVIGKYFSLIAVPDATAYSVVYNANPVPGLPSVSQLSFSRPAVTSSATVDSFHFYIGPNVASELARYDDPKKNSYDKRDLKIGRIKDANPLFGWLEWLLKKAMQMFHFLIPNWGVAIILVTILVKGLFFPLTFKSSVSMAKMADLQPKIKELQDKYKDKPEKLNQEMMAFYKKEGANPLSGCLPMLIQLPIFFAMYALFNTHFDLRGAMFIPGWIPDLSRPDAIPGLTFPTVNLVIWKISAIRALPVIYLVSQLFYGKYTQSSQPTPGQNATQMKIMLYAMPVFFFFVLYDAPAGLLVYWITQNILTIVQQIITNKIIHARKLRRA